MQAIDLVSKGNPQYAEFDPGTLKAIAEETGGKYFESVDDKTLDGIYSNLKKEIKREKEEIYIKDWLFFAALVIFLAYMYMRYGKKRVIQ